MLLDEFAPKQKRSEMTLNKLMDAMMALLETKYFEHITIQEVAGQAGVSVGAFYRRFKNKESALPAIYNRFQQKLRIWLEEAQPGWYDMQLPEMIHSMSDGIYEFFNSQKGVVRTIHLNARLAPEVLDENQLRQRAHDYVRFTDCLVPVIRERWGEQAEDRAAFAIFALVAQAVEKVVYPTLTPALAAPQNLDQSVKQSAEMALAYLKG